MSKEKDMAREKELAAFLDSYIYLKLNKLFIFNRISDKKKQKKGIDLEIKSIQSNKKYNVDEKAQLNYVNKSLPTFAFELESSGKIGWFMNDKLLTDLYILISPYGNNSNFMKKDDYKSVKVIMIKKIIIIKKIENLVNMSLKNLLNIFKEKENGSKKDNLLDLVLSDNKSFKVSVKNNEGLDLKICRSKFLKENPINLVIRIDNLMEMENYSFIANKSSYLKIKKNKLTEEVEKILGINENQS